MQRVKDQINSYKVQSLIRVPNKEICVTQSFWIISSSLLRDTTGHVATEVQLFLHLLHPQYLERTHTEHKENMQTSHRAGPLLRHYVSLQRQNKRLIGFNAKPLCTLNLLTGAGYLMTDMLVQKVMFTQRVELLEHSHRVKVVRSKKDIHLKMFFLFISHIKKHIHLFKEMYKDE